MTREEKELLLRDLCTRLSCRVKVALHKETCILLGIKNNKIYLDVDSSSFDVESIKPYLRPMSSMTEEEYEELKFVEPYYGLAPFEYIGDWGPNVEVLDWLNQHHFDYRGLIEKGLALVAPKDMYEF